MLLLIHFNSQDNMYKLIYNVISKINLNSPEMGHPVDLLLLLPHNSKRQSCLHLLFYQFILNN